MSVSKLFFCLFLFGLVACGSKSDSGNSQNQDHTQDGKTEASTDYVQKANLNLAHTNSELKKLKSNIISLQGLGEKSTYKAIYSFNSLQHESFKVLKTSLNSRFSNCSMPEATMVIKGKNLSQKITLPEQVKLEPNTEYFLEVSFANSCKSLEIDFDLIAWAGEKYQDPKLAILCDAYKTGQGIFFPYVNAITAFTTQIGKEKLLTKNNYCGESFQSQKTECSTKSNMDTNLNSLPILHAECLSENGNEKRGFSIDFDVEDGKASLHCTKNGNKTFSEGYYGCESLILNFGPYGFGESYQ